MGDHCQSQDESADARKDCSPVQQRGSSDSGGMHATQHLCQHKMHAACRQNEQGKREAQNGCSLVQSWCKHCLPYLPAASSAPIPAPHRWHGPPAAACCRHAAPYITPSRYHAAAAIASRPPQAACRGVTTGSVNRTQSKGLQKLTENNALECS